MEIKTRAAKDFSSPVINFFSLEGGIFNRPSGADHKNSFWLATAAPLFHAVQILKALLICPARSSLYLQVTYNQGRNHFSNARTLFGIIHVLLQIKSVRPKFCYSARVSLKSNKWKLYFADLVALSSQQFYNGTTYPSFF